MMSLSKVIRKTELQALDAKRGRPDKRRLRGAIGAVQGLLFTGYCGPSPRLSDGRLITHGRETLSKEKIREIKHL
jgi:hypothetical protein